MSDPKVNTDLDLPPELSVEQDREEPQENKSPTRFGDWEKNGRCIDF